MTRSTSTLRQLHAPACTAKADDYLAAYQALDDALRAHQYRPRSGVTGAYNCRAITGGTKPSLHAYGPGAPFTFWTGVKVTTALAVDINWDTNPYGPRLITDMTRAMIDDIIAIRTRNGAQVWRWGGDYTGNKDAMHFEIIASPTELATGIAPARPPERRWLPVRAGDNDIAIAARGGHIHQIAEAQLILRALAVRLDAPDLHPGVVDGIHGPRTQAAISAFKQRIRALQRTLGQPVWPNEDPHIGPKTIDMLRWWNTATATKR